MWHEISPGEETPKVINVIIECPAGSKNKYEIDKKTGLIKLDRARKTAQDYPFDYGFVPQTLWDDNDPLDVVVLSSYPLSPGILVEARPVGVFRMIDCGEGDDKIIAVPKSDPRWEEVQDLKDVNPHLLKTYKHFFETYKSIEDGKEVVINGMDGKKEALEAVEKGLKMYKEKFSDK